MPVRFTTKAQAKKALGGQLELLEDNKPITRISKAERAAEKARKAGLKKQGVSKRVDYADLLVNQIGLLAPDLTGFQRELTFHPTRKWRFDLGFASEQVGIEVDGGVWKAGGGRHGQDGDREKLNQAAILGWRVLRFSSSMVKQDPQGCINQIREALAKPVS